MSLKCRMRILSDHRWSVIFLNLKKTATSYSQTAERAILKTSWIKFLPAIYLDQIDRSQNTVRDIAFLSLARTADFPIQQNNQLKLY
ncbi:hypothetical protein DSM110093_03855 (plasmid) [Sulfitobacter sp. DSM 110093]|nr:hypothetical protein DSM110093_03594 [Sulfitobacter sp. DSM 110093]UOA34020.1 hypothetical protein DSM110093_03855 [Sulfitobacter sp. DSM 110093]